MVSAGFCRHEKPRRKIDMGYSMNWNEEDGRSKNSIKAPELYWFWANSWRRVLKKLLFKTRLILMCQFKQLNGRKSDLRFMEVYEKFCLHHLSGVSSLTRVKMKERCERWFGPIFEERMVFMNPDRVAEHVNWMKTQYWNDPSGKRSSFSKELKDLKCIFTWWKDHYDFQFDNPVRPFHAKSGKLDDLERRERAIATDEFCRFLEALPPFYRDIAEVQFYCGARIGEVVGIQTKNIDLDRKVLKIEEVITWVRGTPTIRKLPKNGQPREVYINDALFVVISRWLRRQKKNCPFLFHDDGKPLRYNRINQNYNRGWRSAGLWKYSGTHQVRYAAAQMARKLTSSLCAVSSVTGHQSKSMAEKYSVQKSIDLNKSSLILIEKHMAEEFARV